ncbi:MAG: flippase [Thermoplasmata archaeon]
MLSRKSFLTFINNIVAYTTGYVGLFFIARFMTNSRYNYGMVSFAIWFVGLFSFISTVFDGAHVKRISEGQDEGECMGTYISLKTAATIVMVAVIFIGLMFWKYVLGRGFQSPMHETVLYIILIFFVIKQAGRIGVQTFVGKSMIAKAELLKFMDQTVPTIFIIFIVLTRGQAVELASTYLAGGLLMSLLAIFLLKDIKIKKPNLKMIKSYWTFGLPSFISSWVSKLGNRVDGVLVQLFWGSTNVANYAAGNRMAGIITGVSMAVSQVMFPTISKHHANMDWDKIREVVKKSSRYLSLFISPVVIFLLFFPSDVIHIMLSDSWLPAVPIIRILSINAFFMVYSTPFRNIFGGINKPKLGAKISIFGNTINVALNILLIPDSLFGIPLAGLKEVGAAIATLTAGLIITFSSFIISKREVGVFPNHKVIIHILTAVTAGLIILILKTNVQPIDRFYHLIGYSALLLGVYLGILYLIDEFTKSDWIFIWDTIDIRQMWKYIKEELTGK